MLDDSPKESNMRQYDKGYADGRQSVINDRNYNGWSNYETWNVKLWIDNDEGTYNYWREQTESSIQAAVEDGADSNDAKQEATNRIAEQLKSDHEENMPEVNGTYADLLRGALSDVDWYEIASGMVDDYVSDHPEVLESSNA
jgi:hypothetical protein